MLPSIELSDVTNQLRELAEELQNVGKEYDAALTPSPDVLLEGLEKLLEMAHALPPGEDLGDTPFESLDHDPDALLAHGLDLLRQLAAHAERLRLPPQARQIRQLSFPFTLWMLRHGSHRLQHLCPVVEASVSIAHELHAPADLAVLFALTSELTEAIDPEWACEQDEDIVRLWRILLFNRAIIATRSHHPELMVIAFDAIIEHLPDESQDFFREGMEQMESGNPPQPVRDLIHRYYARWGACQKVH